MAAEQTTAAAQRRARPPNTEEGAGFGAGEGAGGCGGFGQQEPGVSPEAESVDEDDGEVLDQETADRLTKCRHQFRCGSWRQWSGRGSSAHSGASPSAAAAES
ncbi:hypothetical protein BRADI_3g31360v3 [Brachypodium distachyon]|uniref:Uncharacterized protein n=1 Tax=Brachypodium distachyon TaxID=15368 RepID=I1I5G7_BRADI|nr:hypothetical protein BRADI_3g31360v3 [Brachypodium distachyon]